MIGFLLSALQCNQWFLQFIVCSNSPWLPHDSYVRNHSFPSACLFAFHSFPANCCNHCYRPSYALQSFYPQSPVSGNCLQWNVSMSKRRDQTRCLNRRGAIRTSGVKVGREGAWCGKGQLDGESSRTGTGKETERRGERGGSSLVITLSIRPQDGLHQPPGLMFDRIIRKLSQSVITGAHLARDHFHPSRPSTHSRTHPHVNTQRAVAICGQPAGRDTGLV